MAFSDSSNRRRFFRCPVSSDCRDALLFLGTSKVPVHLFDESSDGFSVGSEQDLGVTIGQWLVLRTSSGHYQVEVIHAAYVDRPAEFAGTAAKIWRIGVRRIRFLCAENEKPRLAANGAPEWKPATERPRRVSALMIVACLATVVLGGLLIMRRYNDLWYLDHATAGEYTAHALRPETAEGRRPRSEAIHWPVSSETLELRRKVEQLPGAVALTLPKITSRLDLSVSQQEKIQRIIEMTNQALRQYEAAYATASADELQQRRHRVLNAARRDALQVLSPGQREIFEELFLTADQP